MGENSSSLLVLNNAVMVMATEMASGEDDRWRNVELYVTTSNTGVTEGGVSPSLGDYRRVEVLSADGSYRRAFEHSGFFFKLVKVESGPELVHYEFELSDEREA